MRRLIVLLLAALMGILAMGDVSVDAEQAFPMDAQAGYAFKRRPVLPSEARGLPSGSRIAHRPVTKVAPPPPLPGPPPPMNYCAVSPQPCSATGVEPSVYIGYLYKERGAGIRLQFNNGSSPGIGVSSTVNNFDLQGIWLEIAFPMAISSEITTTLRGGHLFSLQPKSIQSYIIPQSESAARRWNPDVFWWEVDGSASYRVNRYLSAVGGFRWTSLGADFGAPYEERGFVTPNSDSETLRTNFYIPYTGMMLENRTDCQSGLKIAAYGSPLLPADFTYNETVSLTGSTPFINPQTNIGVGYFAEGFSEYSMTRGPLSVGGFVRFTAIHCERSVGWNTGSINLPIDVTVDRKNWIFGGKIGYVF